MRWRVLAIVGLALAGCGGSQKPFTRTAARSVLTSCAADARPFAIEQFRAQQLQYRGEEQLNRHQSHAWRGLAGVQGEAADRLDGLTDPGGRRGRDLRAYVRTLRRLAGAEERAGDLYARGEFAAAARVLSAALRPLQLLTYHVPQDLARLGAIDCLTPRLRD